MRRCRDPDFSILGESATGRAHRPLLFCETRVHARSRCCKIEGFMTANLRVTMIQSDLAWQDPAANRHALATHFRGLQGHTDLIVLPEMFSTGFTMNAASFAETMDGPTVGWLREEAAAMGCV